MNLRVTADGNCLYNAVSLSIHGDETLHLVLRLLTSIELFVNFNKYVKRLEQISLDWKTSFPDKFTVP